MRRTYVLSVHAVNTRSDRGATTDASRAVSSAASVQRVRAACSWRPESPRQRHRAESTPVDLPILEPMLATSRPPTRAGEWAFEPKLDGWRAMIYVDDSGVVVRTRS